MYNKLLSLYNQKYISFRIKKTQQIDIMQNNSLLSLKTNNENTSSIHKNDP